MSGLWQTWELIGPPESEEDVRRGLFIAYILDDRDMLRESVQELEVLINCTWKVSWWKRRRLRKLMLYPRRRKLQFIEKLLSGTDLFGRRDEDESQTANQD